MKLYLAYMYNDTTPVVVGIGTDFEAAVKLIKRDYKKYNITGELLIEIKEGEFRKPNSDISETDYFVREVSTNTLI
jgi:hypothetical protein